HHAAQHGAVEMEGGGEVDGDDVIPFLVLHAHEQIVARHAGIVDQDIDATHGGLGGGDELVDLVELAEIGGQNRAILADFLRRIFQGANARARKGDIGADCGERLGDFPAYAAAGAGDQGAFSS